MREATGSHHLRVKGHRFANSLSKGHMSRVGGIFAGRFVASFAGEGAWELRLEAWRVCQVVGKRLSKEREKGHQS